MPYTRSQILLHWIVVLLLIPQFLLHDGMSHAFHQLMDGAGADYAPLVLQHIVTGLAVLALVLWRLVLRARVGAPPLPAQEPALMKLAAHATHWALYALLVLLPLSGLAAWFGQLGTAAEAHEIMKNILLALAGLHIAAALFHQFVLRTNLLARMRRPGAV